MNLEHLNGFKLLDTILVAYIGASIALAVGITVYLLKQILLTLIAMDCVSAVLVGATRYAGEPLMRRQARE